MTLFQLIMLGASAYFAFKVYEHIQTLQDSDESLNKESANSERSVDAFSTFSPESLVARADEAYEEKDFQKALALLTEANAKDARNPEILFKQGYILQQIGEDDKAIDSYKEALELDANNEYIHNSLASVYRKNSEFASAKLHLHASLEIDGNNPVTYYNFGNLLVDMHKNEEAIEMYKKAVELNPDFEEAKEELKKLQGEN